MFAGSGTASTKSGGEGHCCADCIVEVGLLISDVVQQKGALRHGEPVRRVGGPEGRDLDCSICQGRGSLILRQRNILVVQGVCCKSRSPYVKTVNNVHMESTSQSDFIL